MKKPWELVKNQPSPVLKDSSKSAADEEYMKKIKRYNILEMVKKICNLKISEDFND